MQACPNVKPGGSYGPSVWGTSRQDMILKFGTQVKEAKWGPRNFFWVRIFYGGFTMVLQRNLVNPGFWATGKRWEAEISLIRLLTMFHKFSENFKGKLKWSNWVFIELNKYFMKMKSEATWFGHAWSNDWFNDWKFHWHCFVYLSILLISGITPCF